MSEYVVFGGDAAVFVSESGTQSEILNAVFVSEDTTPGGGGPGPGGSDDGLTLMLALF